MPESRYPLGSRVRLVGRQVLAKKGLFGPERLSFANRLSSVVELSLGPLGRPLYRLRNVPGWWEPDCFLSGTPTTLPGVPTCPTCHRRFPPELMDIHREKHSAPGKPAMAKANAKRARRSKKRRKQEPSVSVRAAQGGLPSLGKRR